MTMITDMGVMVCGIACFTHIFIEMYFYFTSELFPYLQETLWKKSVNLIIPFKQ
jgi:hypothetical protein